MNPASAHDCAHLPRAWSLPTEPLHKFSKARPLFVAVSRANLHVVIPTLNK